MLAGWHSIVLLKQISDEIATWPCLEIKLWAQNMEMDIIIPLQIISPLKISKPWKNDSSDT